MLGAEPDGDDEFEQHPERLRALREIRCIGRGATGEAMLVESAASGRLYCVKQISLASTPSPGVLSVEVDVLRRLGHPNVIRFYGAYVHEAADDPRERSLRIVMEYADSGTLAHWLSARWSAVPEDERSALIAEEEIMSCFSQLVDGLAHVHANRVVHRDLKAENILLHRDESLKLADFGVSRLLESTHAMASTCIGSARAAAAAQVRAGRARPRSRDGARASAQPTCSTLLLEPRDGRGAAQVGHDAI